MNTKKLALALMMLCCGITASAQKADTLFDSLHILKIMHRVADWQLNNWTDKGFKYKKYDWTNGACYTGLFDFGMLSNNLPLPPPKGKRVKNRQYKNWGDLKTDKYLKYLVGIGIDLDWNTGPHRQFADDYCVGQTFANLYTVYHDPKMIAKFKVQADSIIAAPHTESLDWKNKINQREWAWCDALYMGPTALSYLSTATKDPKYINKASELWWRTTAFLYDTTEHLYFRDASYFAKKEKNGTKVFWGRGNGWVIAGLVRVLDNMPANHPDRPKFIKLYTDMATRIAALQQPDGSWHASLLDPDSYPIKETSGTGFYTYALLWGLDNNLLDRKTYTPVVKKGWASLCSAVQADGMLGYVQPIGGSPDKVEATSTAVYGVGAFLLTGSKLYHYRNRKDVNDFD